MKIFGYGVRIEIILVFLFFIVPIILPITSGVFQPSLSEYHYTSQRYTYIILFSIIATLISLDGILHNYRRYNILLGLSIFGIVLFPVNEFRILHNSFAAIFFIGNAFIVTYYSRLLVINKKIFFRVIIGITLLFVILGAFNIYVAETIGMFSMSYFMYIRYSILELRDKILV